MADQRRRGGRGRSGRGGRIPRKGEGGQNQAAREDTFASFPLEFDGPLSVELPLDTEAVQRLMSELLGRETRQEAALRTLAEQQGDPVLAELRQQVVRHREALEQLGRELEATLTNGGGGEVTLLSDLVIEQRFAGIGWAALQRVAYATGDRRIDRVVKPVLVDKERHAAVLHEYAIRAATATVFRDEE